MEECVKRVRSVDVSDWCLLWLLAFEMRLNQYFSDGRKDSGRIRQNIRKAGVLRIVIDMRAQCTSQS
jgi:hypothetical protein